MDTSDIMRLALEMSGFESIPPDSGIWNPGKSVKKALFAIDGGASELLLAKQLGYDLLIAHHPVGPAKLTFPRVVERHLGFMLEKGVPRKVAEQATNELVTRIEVGAHPNNYMHDVAMAKRLQMGYMNIHLPVDQITREFLLKEIRGAKAKTVGDLVASLEEISEFKRAKTRVAVWMGDRKNKLGNWVLLFAAGTNGGYPVAKAYFENGVDTVIYLHIQNDELVKLKKDCRGNLIVLGHMAGDAIGANIFVKALRRRGVKVDTLDVVN
ncbi:MAG: hypothetical protein JRM73_01300 [Nitrososphaerota archaeon]|nr:hypothetical protein [Nitrososphaerota archaeon]